MNDYIKFYFILHVNLRKFVKCLELNYMIITYIALLDEIQVKKNMYMEYKFSPIRYWLSMYKTSLLLYLLFI